jgi:hypothetical protein
LLSLASFAPFRRAAERFFGVAKLNPEQRGKFSLAIFTSTPHTLLGNSSISGAAGAVPLFYSAKNSLGHQADIIFKRCTNKTFSHIQKNFHCNCAEFTEFHNHLIVGSITHFS